MLAVGAVALTVACGRLEYGPRPGDGAASALDAAPGDAAIDACSGACCTGCTSGAECQPGTADDACGARGEACIACTGATPQCGTIGRCTVPRPIVEVSAGAEHQCVLDAEGTVYCWGDDSAGQIGARDPAGRCLVAAPIAVPLPMPALDVRAGENATCAVLADGTGRCWGAAPTGSGTVSAASTCLDGTGTAIARSPGALDPVVVDPLEGPVSWARLAPANGVRFGLSAAGVPYYWGDYAYVDALPPERPTLVGGAAIAFVELQAYSQFAAGRSAANDLYVWGRPLIVPSVLEVAEPALVAGVDVFHAGADAVCWTTIADPRVECRGVSLGDVWPIGANGGRRAPQPEAAIRVTSLAVAHLGGITMVCWTNVALELRCASTGWTTSQRITLGDATDFVSVTVGRYQYVAIDVAGRAWRTHFAELPSGAVTSTTLPP
jgi:hypothetical protein